MTTANRMGVVFTSEGAIFTVGNGNVIHYQRINGIYFHSETPADVARILEQARSSRRRIRLYYGDMRTRRDWLEEYDVEGHVKSAKPLHGKDSAKPLDFVWDGDKLLSITERGGEYRRVMRYDGARLIGETVTFRGKTSKITYKYNGDRLVEADCDDDTSIDSRSRHVTFGN